MIARPGDFPAPPGLDPETRLEWDAWVGRRVWARPGVVGVVYEVWRRSFALVVFEGVGEERAIDTLTPPEAVCAASMRGETFYARVVWGEAPGDEDVRLTTWLKAVDTDVEATRAAAPLHAPWAERRTF